MRPSRRSATSSTRACSAWKASWSELACATRSSRPLGPRTARWSARRRRSRKASTTASTSAISATAPAASAASPAGWISSSTAQECTSARRGAERRSALREDALVLRLVVVGLLLAGDRRHADGDGDRGALRGRLLEGEVGGRAGLRRDLVDRVGQRDRVAAPALDLHGHLDVELVVVPAVGELDGEGGVGRVGELVGGVRLQRGVAVGGRVDARAVQAGARRLAAVAPRAGGELLPEALGHHVR